MLENSLLEAEVIPIVNCHSTPTKNQKVQNIPYDVGLTGFKGILWKKIESKHFTENTNRFKTATKKWTKDNSCAKNKYYEHFSSKNWTKNQVKIEEKRKTQSNLQIMFVKISSYNKLIPIKI